MNESCIHESCINESCHAHTGILAARAGAAATTA